MRNKRYTLVVCRLEGDDAANSILAEFFDILDDLDLGAKTIYLNHGLYNNEYLMLLQMYNHTYVMPIIRWGRAVKRGPSEEWSHVI